MAVTKVLISIERFRLLYYFLAMKKFLLLIVNLVLVNLSTYADDHGFYVYSNIEYEWNWSKKYNKIKVNEFHKIDPISHKVTYISKAPQKILFKTKGFKSVICRMGYFFCGTEPKGNGKIAVFGPTGKKIIKASNKYVTIDLITDRDATPFFLVKDKHQRCGLIDTLGKIVIPTQYFDITYSPLKGFVCNGMNGSVEYDFSKFPADHKEGNTKYRIKNANKSIWNMDQVWYLIETANGLGAENEKGKVIVPARYTQVYYDDNHNDYRAITSNGYIGVYSKSGDILVSEKWGYKRIEYQGQCHAYKDTITSNKKFTVISGGKEIINPWERHYDKIERQEWFYNTGDCYRVWKGENVGICDYHTGEEIIAPTVFENVYYLNYKDNSYKTIKELFMIVYQGKRGVISKDGNIVVPIEYARIWDEYEGWFSASFVDPISKKKRMCAYDIEGNLVAITPEDHYQDIKYNSEKGFHIEIDGYIYEYGVKIGNNYKTYRYTPVHQMEMTETKKAQIEAEKKRELRRERRAAIAAAFVGAASRFTNGMILQHQQSANPMGVSNLSGKAYLLDPNYIKVQYLQETNNGRTMTFEQWLNIKAPVSGGSSVSGDNESYDSNSSSPSRKACTACKYTNGKCPVCKGTGRKSDNSFGISQTAKCDHCGGDGKCPSCGGDGWR